MCDDPATRRILAARRREPTASITEVARLAGVSERTAWRRIAACRDSDLAITTQLQSRDQIEAPHVRSLRERGMSILAISLETGISRKRIDRLLREG